MLIVCDFLKLGVGRERIVSEWCRVFLDRIYYLVVLAYGLDFTEAILLSIGNFERYSEISSGGKGLQVK